jgi:hypothetical protein
MSRATTIKLPALDLSSTKSGHPLKSRARSGSIVKVEEVGDRSIDEVLDRGAYVNINADWVNAKGASPTFTSCTRVQPNPSRCVADPRRPHHPWENHRRHYPWDDTTNQLDFSKLVIPGCMLAMFLLLMPWLIHFAPPQLSYLMFHWVTGIPFENDLHGGAYDDLTLWEQIDDGAQYTPAKKWLFTVPIGL